MQRKKETEEARKEALQEKEQRESMEWTAQDDDGKEGSSEEDSMSVPQIATSSDMYGMKSDLIGRRSFGGYRPKVSETWKSAITAWEKGKAGDKAAREHISDEELLRRYKHYVTGKGNFGDIDAAAAAPIGNLADKLKKGRRKSQSPTRGEKRKR